jgi:hypothetical protein
MRRKQIKKRGLILLCRSLCLLLTSLSQVYGAAFPDSGKGEVPKDLCIELKTLPLDQNAVILWRRAAQTRPIMDDKIKSAMSYAWAPGMRLPDSGTLDMLRSWLRRNQEPMALIEESLTKPLAQWPERDPNKTQPELEAFVCYGRARLLQADEFAEHGSFTNAARTLCGTMRMAQVGIDADGALNHYLAAGSMRVMVHKAMLRLAGNRDTPPALLDQLLASLPSLDSDTNSYNRALRVEFTYYIYPDLNLRKVLDNWNGNGSSNAIALLFPEELQRPFRVLMDPLLVPMHPQPFDQAEAVESAITDYRRFLTNIVSAWTNRMCPSDEELDSIREQLLEDIAPLMEVTKNEPLPLSMRAAQRARSCYLTIDNPIGRLFQCRASFLSQSDKWVFRNRTDREATRAALGLLILERKNGHLPGNLKELVEAHVLTSLPWDYFANAPLNYSHDRRLIWSTGEDAIDNHGTGKPKERWTSQDAVWQIPEGTVRP